MNQITMNPENHSFNEKGVMALSRRKDNNDKEYQKKLQSSATE
jgi:hypothetical protein